MPGNLRDLTEVAVIDSRWFVWNIERELMVVFEKRLEVVIDLLQIRNSSTAVTPLMILIDLAIRIQRTYVCFLLAFK